MPYLKDFVKYIALSTIFLSLVSSASESPSQEKTPFTLPTNLTLWQEATNKYMEPVLTTQSLNDKWQVLLDLTMPKDGNFDPTNPARRATTIIQAYKKMLLQDEGNRLVYLNGLLARHEKYVSHTH